MTSLALELLLHWRIQQRGLCICYPDGEPRRDGEASRRECTQDVRCAFEPSDDEDYDPWGKRHDMGGGSK